MSGRFRLIYLGDISRDDHLEFTYLSNLIKKIISMRKFLCALFFSTTTIMLKCKNSQAPKSSNHDDVSDDYVISNVLEQFLEQYFFTLDKRVVLKAVRLRLFWVGRGSIDISTLYEVPSNEKTLQYQSVISFFTSLPVKILLKISKNWHPEISQKSILYPVTT